MRIVTLFLSLALSAFSNLSYGIQYPVMTSAEITSCNNGPVGECSEKVRYKGTIEYVEIGNPVQPLPQGMRYLHTLGVHCYNGDAARGIPFSNCGWSRAGVHSPAISTCTVKPGSWETEQTCFFGVTWGAHTGAAPGGECVMIGDIYEGGRDVVTPFGIFTAEQVANGGNRFCVKPQRPSVTCEVTLPSLIDHGRINTGSMDSKIINGLVNCGTYPVVTVVGSPLVTLGKGVSTKISTTMSSPTDLRIQSDMTIERTAKPGQYSGVIIVAVSPY